MRYSITTIIIGSLLLLSAPLSFAATPTPAASPTPSTQPSPTNAPKISEDPKNINILNELKNKIASKVAQLNLVQKKGVMGTITNISGTQITLEDIHGDEAILDVDELTKFSSPSAKSAFGISDLTKGSIVDVLGLYNKQSKHILARFIDVITLPRYVDGEVAAIDADNYVVTVIQEGGTMTPVDIENITKTLMYTKDEGLGKGGFSKIEVGQHIIVRGYSNVKDKKRIVASRVLIFPEIPQNPRIIIPQEALNPDTTTVPSTGSGRKLTPITR